MPAGRSARPDHHGSTAWVFYMGGVLVLYIAFVALIVPYAVVVAGPVALFAQVFFFGIGSISSLVGLLRDELKTRAALGLIFPPVALMMVRVIFSSFFDGSREHANLRSCYANQKTIAGAVEITLLPRVREKGSQSLIGLVDQQRVRQPLDRSKVFVERHQM